MNEATKALANGNRMRIVQTPNSTMTQVQLNNGTYYTLSEVTYKC